MSQWYYADRSRQRQGPVEAAELAALFHRNEVGPDTLVWRPGLEQWQALGDFAGELGLLAEAEAAPAQSASAASAPAAGSIAGDDAHAAVAVAEAEPVASPADDFGVRGPEYPVSEPLRSEPLSPYAPPTASVAVEDSVVHGGEVVYAGFWKRFAALAIDNLLVGVVYYAIVIAAVMVGVGGSALSGGLGESPPAGLFAVMGVVYLCYPLISALYFVGFESSAKQATLGKMAVGIKVVDDNGQRLSRGRALARWASHLLCYLTVYIGYAMAAFTDRKRGLHDMVASTLVVDRWAYTASPQLQRRELGTVATVIIILAVLGLLAYLAIIFAIAIPAYQGYVERAAGMG